MKIRTTEHLIDFLNEEIKWRKLEISYFKNLIDSSQKKKSQHQALLRLAPAMLYAHWEGFIKKGAHAYLEYIANKRIPYQQLATSFQAIILKHHYRDDLASLKTSKLINIIKVICNQSDKSLPTKNIIDTGANLNSERFKEIILCLGLDYALYATKENFIDNNLLHLRNKIAHGEQFYPTYDEYYQLHEIVLALIETFKNQVENAAIQENYKNRL